MTEAARASCPQTSILIVDDTAEWRAQVRSILGQRPELQVVAEACDGFQAVQIAAELNPDLVLLDVGMPVMNGIKAAEEIRLISTRSKIVFLTQEIDDDVRNTALAAGAHAYVLKSNAGGDLLRTLATVLGNGHHAH